MNKPSKVDFHGALNIFDEACLRADHSIKLIVNPLGGQFIFFKRSSLLNKILRKIGIFFRHLKLVLNLYLEAQRNDILIIREFSTIPLLFFIPLLFPLMSRLRFIVNHNLQWALRNKIEQWAFSCLCKLGVGFIFFEINIIDHLTQFQSQKTRHWVLPHPVGPLKTRMVKVPSEYVIGVIGQYRSEKGMDEIISVLLDLKKNTTKKIQLIMGFSNVDDFFATSIHSGKGLKILDTRKDEDYYNAICSCDILLLNYQKDAYMYRASGLIADAASCQTAIIIPDSLPVLYKQLTTPCSIGEIFPNVNDLKNTIFQAMNKVKGKKYNFVGYYNGRNSQALAKKLDKFCLQRVL